MSPYNLIPIMTALTLTACGGGGTSSGGNIDNVATQCLEISDVHSNGVTFKNKCSYDVNVISLTPNRSGIYLIKANSKTRVDKTGFITYGACRAPSIPTRLGADKFSCS